MDTTDVKAMEVAIQLLQDQNHLLLALMGIIGIIFVALLALQWYWNQKVIRNAVRQEFDEFRDEKAQELEDELTKRTEIIAKGFEDRFGLIEAEASRHWGITLVEGGSYRHAVDWLCRAIDLYSGKSQRWVRACTDVLVGILEGKQKQISLDQDMQIRVTQIAEILPDEMLPEKRRILEELKKMDQIKDASAQDSAD